MAATHLLHCAPEHHVSFERFVLHLSGAEADSLQGSVLLCMRVIVKSGPNDELAWSVKSCR